MLALLCLLASCSQADESYQADGLGEYEVGFRNVLIEREDESEFSAWVFYPADRTQRDEPIIEGNSRFPAISFGHGFLQPVNRYKHTLRFLASHGYLVIATNSHRGIAPDHAQYSRDMARCLSHLIEQGRDDASWIAGRVDEDALALSGHSMGGGGAEGAAGLIAVRVLIPLAGAPLRGEPGEATQRMGNPAELHIVGDHDRIVPPATSRVIFKRGCAERVFATIAGGSHCGFMDETILGCDQGTIEHNEQLRITRALMLAFLELHLKGNEEMHGPVWIEHDDEKRGLVQLKRVRPGSAEKSAEDPVEEIGQEPDNDQ
ncbi:MAG: hypothetical protein WD114_05085 [Phycisphaerales bacterium]